jgi:hypothetical protein
MNTKISPATAARPYPTEWQTADHVIHRTGRPGPVNTFRTVDAGLVSTVEEGPGLTTDDIIASTMGGFTDDELAWGGSRPGPSDIVVFRGDVVEAIIRRAYNNTGAWQLAKIGRDSPLFRSKPDTPPEFIASYTIRGDNVAQLASFEQLPDRDDDDDDQAEPDEPTDAEVVTLMIDREEAESLALVCHEIRKTREDLRDLEKDRNDADISDAGKDSLDAAIEGANERIFDAAGELSAAVIKAAKGCGVVRFDQLSTVWLD